MGREGDRGWLRGWILVIGREKQTMEMVGGMIGGLGAFKLLKGLGEMERDRNVKAEMIREGAVGRIKGACITGIPPRKRLIKVLVLLAFLAP